MRRISHWQFLAVIADGKGKARAGKCKYHPDCSIGLLQVTASCELLKRPNLDLEKMKQTTMARMRLSRGFRKLFEVFVGSEMCLDLFGPSRIRLDTFGCARKHLEAFGRFCFF